MNHLNHAHPQIKKSINNLTSVSPHFKAYLSPISKPKKRFNVKPSKRQSLERASHGHNTPPALNMSTENLKNDEILSADEIR